MKILKKNKSAIRLFIFFFLQSGLALGADQGDIYLEAKGGTNLEVTTELISGAQLGYVFMDSVGAGLSIEQYFSTTIQSAGKEGFQIGPELRWFLEPLEFTGSVGVFSNSLKNVLYFSGAGTYLFALSPALAFATDIRVRYIVNEGSVFYFLAGLRILF
jgi:hypothetical protein